MRKVLSVVLAATMAMSLAACGGSGAKTDTKAADAGTAAGDEASADDYYITIKFSNRQSGTTKPANIWQTW